MYKFALWIALLAVLLSGCFLNPGPKRVGDNSHDGHDHAHDDAYYAELAKNYAPFVPDAGQLKTVSQDEYDLYGQWGSVIPWPHVAVSAANLPDGRVLTFASNERTSFPRGPEYTHAAVWDPQTGSFLEVPHSSHDMFCAATTMLEDGSIFVNGGRNDSPLTSVFNYQTNTWETRDLMNRGRWYPGSVALPSGEVMTAIGRGGDRYPELWSAGGWRLLTGADLTDPILKRRVAGYQNNWLPYLHLAPGGDIFHSGPTDIMSLIDPSGNGNISPTGSGADWYFKYGTGLMFAEGKLLLTGGGDTASANNNAAVVDLNGPHPELRDTQPMTYARKFSNGTVLPNGEVLVIGGNTSGTEFKDEGSILVPELWSPETETWRSLAPMTVPRNYHSVALLLTDGRVLSAGGGLCDCPTDHQDAQVYSPPYLFNADGSLATRPVISAAPATAAAGQTISVQATPGMASFSLVKMSATNHHLNSDLRRLEPSFGETSAGTYELSLSGNENVLTPGYWMLFALNAQGTPSVAATVQVRTTAPKLTHPGNQSHVEGESVSVSVQASDPNGDTLSFSATGLPTGLSVHPDSGQISGVVTAAGSYNVALTVSDGEETTTVSFDWLIYTAGNQPGLSYQYFEGDWGALPDFSTLLPDEVGTVANFDLSPRNRLNHFGFRFEGNLRVSKAGDYTFYLSADDRANLWLDGQLVVSSVYPNESSATVSLTQGDHRLSVSFQEGGGGEHLSVDYEGPDFARRPVRDSALFQTQAPVDSYRYVRLESRSVFGQGPSAEVAEFKLLDSSGEDLPRAQWTAFADSEASGSSAANAVDGDGGSVWRSGADGHPHSLTVSLGQGEVVGGFRYLPNQASASDGRIANYRFYGSNDGLNWTLLNSGRFTKDLSEKTVLLNPVNQAPNLSQPNDISSAEDETIQYQLVASDPDGDTLSFSASDLPDGLSLDTSSGLISGTLPFGAAGSYAVGAAVSDGELTDTVTFTWTVGVTNRPPSLTTPGDQTGANDISVSLPVVATDPDGDVLSYSASGLPDGLEQNSATGVISGTLTTPGSYTVSVSVEDGRGGSDALNFTWQVESVAALSLDTLSSSPKARGQLLSYSASSSGGVNPRFRWLFGDGSPETAPSDSPEMSHSFSEPGRYVVTVTAQDDRGDEVSEQFVQLVHAPLSAGRPNVSMSVLFEAGANRVWNVNPDNDSVSVLDAQTLAKLAETPVAAGPRALAQAPDGRIWVTAKHAARISILDPTSLGVAQTLDLPYASQPFGLVFSPTRNEAYVALEATGQVLKLDATSGAQLGAAAVGPNVRHLSVSADGTTLYASRFISPPVPGEATASPQVAQGGGEVLAINTSAMTFATTLTLAHGDGPDAETSGRGLPNYLGPAVVSPDGLWAWVPSKQDNLLRGALRDGRDLNFEHTLRSVSSKLDLSAGREVIDARVDHDNGGIASTAAFGPYGIHLFVALEGSREVAVVEALSNAEVLRFDVGRAPQGLVLSPDGKTLYVHNFMDRSVSAFDVRALINRGERAVTEIDTTQTVSGEALGAQVLLGKQLFYDARDTRLARDAYISCAACHNDGAHDGRVWDFSGFGEGLRETISLEGRAGAQGRLHWSANFDEVQDFEGQIRNMAEGTGLMSDAQFNATQDPLGAPKAGRSSDLDALAAYVQSLDSVARSPYRNSDGSLKGAGVAGKTVFEAASCAACHGGAAFSDSDQELLHDVGTLKPSSGGRLGASLDGIDTPTLRGVWNTAPYLHDGSAPTLADAVAAHSGVSLSSADLADLVTYLRQIDANEAAPTPNPSNTAPVLSAPAAQSNVEGDAVSLQVTASDADGDTLTYSAANLPPGLSIDTGSGLISGTLPAGSEGLYTVTLSVEDGNGGSDSAQLSWTVEALPTNQLPVLADPGDQQHRVGDSVSLQLSATDADGDTLAYSATDLPPGLSLDAASGLIQGTPNAAGSFDVSLSVDDGAATDALTLLWTILPANTLSDTAEVRISRSSDDAEELSDGSMYLLSSDIELTEDGGQQTVGLRFPNLNVPPEAFVTRAYVQFQVDETSSGAAQLTLEAEASGDAAAFTYDPRNVGTRARTGASVSWSPAPWTSVGAQGPDQRSPDLSALIQEVVNRPDWQSGNALALIVSGTGKRVAESADGTRSAAPLLHVEFETERPDNSDPDLDLPTNQSHTDGDTVNLQLSASDIDGDTLSYSASGLPPGLTLNSSSGLISGTLSSNSVGDYRVDVTVSDAQGGSDSGSFNWHVSAAGTSLWFTAGIVAGEDDAEEYLDNGSMRLSSTDLELGVERRAQAVGVRYRDVTIPPGATITSARLSFTVDEYSPGAASLVIRGEASGDASVYSGTAGDITRRPLTGSSVAWNSFPVWNENEVHRSPDLSAIVQEVVSGAGWQNGNALAFVMTGSGTKTAESFNGEPGSAPQLAIEYLVDTLPTSLDIRIDSGRDDAEERGDGTLYRNSTDLEITTDQSQQTVGLRFNNLAIPQGATVTNAHLQFKVDEKSSDATAFTLQAQAADDAQSFEYTTGNLSSRPRTAAQVSWSPAAWTVVGEVGYNQRSPNIRALLQEVVDRPGWQAGNSVVIVITGTGKRVAESFNGDPAGAPLLHVDFEE